MRQIGVCLFEKLFKLLYMEILIRNREKFLFNLYKFYFIELKKNIIGYLNFGILCIVLIIISINLGAVYVVQSAFVCAIILFRPFFDWHILLGKASSYNVGINKDNVMTVARYGTIHLIDLTVQPLLKSGGFYYIKIWSDDYFFMTQEHYSSIKNA